MIELELHPLCTLFPRMVDQEFLTLTADIKENGLRQPITLLDGMILDGGNRYRACLRAGVSPKFVDFDGGNIVSFVLSANLHRRHMSAGQQAAIVASAQDWSKSQTVGNPQLRNVAQLDTAKDRAAISGASHRTQQSADKVAKANPALAKQVAHGEKSLPAALKEITPPKPVVEPAYNPADDEAEEMKEAVRTIAAENDVLRVRLAMDANGATDEEKAFAFENMEAKDERIRALEAEVSALRASRDKYQRDNADMKSQLASQRKLIAKLQKVEA